jgi:hypothetical protein
MNFSREAGAENTRTLDKKYHRHSREPSVEKDPDKIWSPDQVGLRTEG